MFKRVTRGWLVRAGIASAMGAAAIFATVTIGGLIGTSQAAPNDVVVTVNGGGLQPLGGSFPVTTDATINNLPSGTYGGWTTQLAWNNSIINLTADASGGLCVPASNWGGPPSTPGNVIRACAFQSSAAGSPPSMENFTFQCVGPGTTPIHLVTIPEDGGPNGSAFFDENAVTIDTTLVDGSVTCALPISKTDNTGGTAAAGSTVTYTVHVGNPTANAASIPVVADTVPAPLTNVTLVSSSNTLAVDGCSNVLNAVTCTAATANAGTGFDLVFTADIPLSAAGTTICNTAQENPPNGLTSANDCFNVAPASLTVTKVADQASYSTNDPITWTITVTSNGPSPAAAVTVLDTAIEGFTISSQAVNSGSCVAGGTTSTTATFNCGDMAAAATSVVTVTGTVNATAPADQTCDNKVDANSTNGASSTQTVLVPCKPPFTHVQFVKSTDTDPFSDDSLQNLWLCAGVNCVPNGWGHLDINEIIIPATIGGSDPQGVGAFEFQVKYDNHIFDIEIDPTPWLYSTGRVPGDPAVGGCAATIITENDIRFGCVSKNPQPLAPQTGCLGPDNVTVVTTAICGTNSADVAAIIHVTPKADLSSRITPGNDNGVIRTLLDEGCEVADIWGHPLSAATGAPIPGVTANGYDALGREIPLDGILPGGLVADCGDMTITVRVLEGDMNKDCVVDVADDQTEASHYGAFFGVLLYQPWYDLEPALKDGDVDIKDLQKVFGRNGSTCGDPVPPQNPQPDPDP